MTEPNPDRSPSTPIRRSTYLAPADEDAFDDATTVSPRRAGAAPSSRASARRSEAVDDTTTRMRRRGTPTGAAASALRDEPVDDVTRISRRSAGTGGAIGSPHDVGAGSVSTADSANDGERAPGPRRSGAITPAPPQRDPAPNDEIDTAGETVLRPSRRAPAPAPQQSRLDDPAPVVGSGRAAYVPTAEHIADRRAPRTADAAVAPRLQAPSPRALDRMDASAPPPPRRSRVRSRLLLLGGGMLLAGAVCVGALVLLLT